jgi:hypothetical protein
MKKYRIKAGSPMWLFKASYSQERTFSAGSVTRVSEKTVIYTQEELCLDIKSGKPYSQLLQAPEWYCKEKGYEGSDWFEIRMFVLPKNNEKFAFVGFLLTDIEESDAI